MNTLIHADVFFFVTTIFVVVFTVVMAVAMAFVILILRDMKRISTTMQQESDRLAEDLESIREVVRTGGIKTASVFSFFFDLFKHRQTARKTRSKKTSM